MDMLRQLGYDVEPSTGGSTPNTGKGEETPSKEKLIAFTAANMPQVVAAW